MEELSSALLVRVIGTKDGAKLGIFCVKHGSAKVLFSSVMQSQFSDLPFDGFILLYDYYFATLFQERKKIIKGMKGHIDKIAYHKYGCMVRM